MPSDDFEICDSNVDMGYADNMSHLFGGNFKTFESLGNFSGYDAARDPYCIYLVDEPRKIVWHNFFDYSFDFSLIKRALIFFALILCMLFYYQVWKPYAEEFGKLLRALTMSALDSQVLKCDGVGDAP